MQHTSSTARRTLLALTAAAAFGGFAATGLNLMLDTPAGAQPPASVAAVPATAALPTAVSGVPVPSLACIRSRTRSCWRGQSWSAPST